MKYIASWSGGKDSTASIILAHEHGEPLDLIIFSEVMFDANISGELPEHIDFIKNKAIPMFESWGYETKILRSNDTYIDRFYRYPSRGKRKGCGLRIGFPMAMKCDVNKSCKIKPIKDFMRGINDFTQYVGIAVDEQVRMERIVNSEMKVSLLERYNYTERMAFEKCRDYDLLSPIYDFAKRGGCWFCPNARREELQHLRTNHRNLWDKLLNLENEPDLIGYKWNMLKDISIHDWDERIYWESRQINIFTCLGRKKEYKVENVKVREVVELLNKKENRETAAGTERIICLTVNNETLGYVTSVKVDGWGSGLIADIGLYLETEREKEEEHKGIGRLKDAMEKVSAAMDILDIVKTEECGKSDDQGYEEMVNAIDEVYEYLENAVSAIETIG